MPRICFLALTTEYVSVNGPWSSGAWSVFSYDQVPDSVLHEIVPLMRPNGSFHESA